MKMKDKSQHSILVVGQAVAFICAASALLAQDANFDDLPSEVKDYAVAVRAKCVAHGSDAKPYDDPMQGITFINLDKRAAWMVDDERLCNEATHGANCDDSGCDLKIWTNVGGNRWKLVFDEQVLRNFPSIDRGSNSLNFIMIALKGGDDRCSRPPEESCDFVVSYKDGRWQWDSIY
jgi:hypothetical protein